MTDQLSVASAFRVEISRQETSAAEAKAVPPVDHHDSISMVYKHTFSTKTKGARVLRLCRFRGNV